MSLLVDNPIVNNPFDEPARYWEYRDGQPVLVEGRRPAGYYLRARTRGEQASLFEEEFIPLERVMTIRRRVRAWREAGYPGVTSTTRQLLALWNDGSRERRLFFCQREAAETLIWLVEASPGEREGLIVPGDGARDPLGPTEPVRTLRRYGLKMATGSGKTVVMAMLIAWQVLNKLASPQDRRFSDAVLVLCPNLTVRERLQVLIPSKRDNYYDRFELLPASLRERLHQGRYVIVNWQVLKPRDDSRRKGVIQRGPEGGYAFCRRVLASLGTKQNILVVNDEAHHAYRPAPLPAEDREALPPEVVRDREAATVWVSGLDKIGAARGINFCADFSATPFYIKGSGYDEGVPFPWVVSDFGLVDAIESGVVKIPRVPVDDNTGAPIAAYFRLWEWINHRLPPSERQTARRRAKPESVLREAEGALVTLASEWSETLNVFERSGSPVPPALIVVCDNTDLSQIVYEHISKGHVLPALENGDREVTVRIDTKLLEDAERGVPGDTKQMAADKLRKTVDTVGKTDWEGDGDPPGKNVRCVVSVAMLTEGWDAHNVTQILGLRAFTSQLLCEQVVGRGLRRMNYDDFSEPEYVDVYGVPFEVIPVKKKPVTQPGAQAVSTLVRALPDRRHLEITFPRVEGYVFDVRQRIRANLSNMPYLLIGPASEPTEVVVKPAVGYRLGRPDRLGPGQEVVHDRNPFHREKRLQTSVYEIAAELTGRLKDTREEWAARHILFPQVLEIVWEYLHERVHFSDDETPPEEVGLLKYKQRIVERLLQAIEPDTSAGEHPLLPVIERFRPIGSTAEVLFRTARPTVGTTKSHISHVVLDSPQWEHTVAYRLERSLQVAAYARNDHLDFVIPYEWQGLHHDYRPDYLVRLHGSGAAETKVILEVKGFEREEDRQKEAAARRWVRAMNYHGGFGCWYFAVCADPGRLAAVLKPLAAL